MTVLIVANADIGLYKFRKELLEELVKENEVYIALPKGEFYEELIAIGCHFIVTELERHGTNPAKELKVVLLYKNIIEKVKPDIVFTYTIKPNVYAGMVCAYLNVPYVANVTGLGTAVENSGLMQIITLNLYRFGLRKAQKVFFQNTANRDFMIAKKVVKGSHDILPGSGVNLDDYTVFDYPNRETIDFIFVSRIMKEKGIDQYLDAAKEIREKYPETRFHICGFCEQDYEEKLKKLNADGTIIYHGFIKNMTVVYRQMSCTILPTYYPEGLSNVLLESAASGCPIITTDRPGCREVVDNGKNGYLVEEKNSKDLIEKIEMFLSKSVEERKQMGLAGRKKVEKEFNRQIVIEKYLAEINSL
ncbi:MAG: glycosyltransferase family 4 protein [Ruminococcaceae bacterium]|nr:glycosyltransferase family 4 protein [Oscillospiraceae bacterium]